MIMMTLENLKNRARPLMWGAMLLAGIYFVLSYAHYMGVAHAAGQAAEATATVTSVGDSTWDMVSKDGPFWAALLVVAGLLRTFLNKQHWLAQGKILSGLTGLSMVAAAVVAWKFMGAPLSGILTAVFAAYTLITHSTVPGALPKPDEPAKPSSPVVSGSLVAMLAVLMIGVAATGGTGCAASQRESTIRAALITTDASREAYVAYDSHAQADIVARAVSLEDGQAKLAAHRAGRAKIQKALEVAYLGIATAAQLNDDLSLANMQTAIKDVITAIVLVTGGKP